jgi:hypothetical protein
MRCWRPDLAIVIITIAACSIPANALPAPTPGGPRITTQGFSVDTALVGKAGSFGSIRVRIEAPSRIAKLIISTDELEIDLANTQDRSMFALFGLDQRPLHAYDVTLDVAPFINKYLTAPTTYRLAIDVVDRGSAMAAAALTATVIEVERSTLDAEDSETLPQKLRESAMTLTRQAASNVAPAETSPLTWVTREPVNVTILLRPTDPDAEIRQLPPETWKHTLTLDGLERKIADLRPLPYVEVPAARNGAAGTVLAISGSGGYTMIRITASTTRLSQLGTTVKLAILVRD